MYQSQQTQITQPSKWDAVTENRTLDPRVTRLPFQASPPTGPKHGTDRPSQNDASAPPTSQPYAVNHTTTHSSRKRKLHADEQPSDSDGPRASDSRKPRLLKDETVENLNRIPKQADTCSQATPRSEHSSNYTDAPKPQATPTQSNFTSGYDSLVDRLDVFIIETRLPRTRMLLWQTDILNKPFKNIVEKTIRKSGRPDAKFIKFTLKSSYGDIVANMGLKEGEEYCQDMMNMFRRMMRSEYVSDDGGQRHFVMEIEPA